MKESDFHILVVDDEETMRRSLADILRLEGYRVQSVGSGEAAIDLLSKSVYDLILLDLKMPGVDGLEVMRVASRVSPDTQIIMLTAHGSLESAIEALRHSAHDYLLKPSSPEQIVQSVRKALSRRIETEQRKTLLQQMEVSIKALQKIDDERSPSDKPQDRQVSPGIMIDLARRVIWNDQLQVSLTPTEGRLMKVLLENRKRVFTHRELVLRVQGYDATEWEAPEILRPLVSRLRRKLEQFPGGDTWIASVRGTGYVFDHLNQTVDREKPV